MSSGSSARNSDSSDTRDRPLKEYFCLADGRTAALLNSQAGCDFLCWPTFDSPLRLAALLDRRRGGSVAVTPTGGPITTATWRGGSRAARYTRPDGVRIDVGLVADGAEGSALVWLVDGPGSGSLLISPTNPEAGRGSGWQETPGGASLGPALLEDGPGGPLTLLVSASTVASDAGLLLEMGPDGIVVWVGASPR